MRRLTGIWFIFVSFALQGQVKLHLDSQLLKAYESRYPWGENLLCIPFYCDPFYESFYNKSDTVGLCGRYVFVDRSYAVRIRPGFDMPCWFQPRFSEGLCAVSKDGQIVYIDTTGVVRIHTGLQACSPQKNKVLPFKNGRSKVYRGGVVLKHYYDIYYIDRNGNRIPAKAIVKVKPKPPPTPVIVASVTPPVQSNSSAPTKESDANPVNPYFELPVKNPGGKYHPEPMEASVLLKGKVYKDNLLLLYYNCGAYQIERMGIEDTSYCDKWVFTDTFFNVRIAGGFTLPCGFEPEFSEGLCAVAKDSMIVYMDVNGRTVVQTGLKACSPENNKASTFRNGIATLYAGSPQVKGLYTTIAINTKGERVRLLEFDDLELAELKVGLFSNLTPEEAVNCFVGKGKTNGLWFLVEKSGKIRKNWIRFESLDYSSG